MQIANAQDNYPRLTGASWPPSEHIAYCLTASERPLRALKCPTKMPFFQVIPLVSSNLKICEFSVLSQELCLKIERNDLSFCILSVSLPLLSDSMGIWTECELTWDEMLFSAQALGINRLKDSYKWIESIVSVFWMSLNAETFSCCSKGPEFHP